ncbi:MAG: hypothetical protein NE327_19155 [Lentisphaeraceae bacterium]|nr:hypothetical protein [Lentisphaeraceae bacterium]
MKLFLILIFSLALSSCQESKTINTTSESFSSKDEKVQFLKSYLTLNEDNFIELDFYINYQDNSGGMVPGPNDWDICFIAKVKDVSPWIEDKKKLETKPADLRLDKIKTNINYSSVNQWFNIGSNDYLGVDNENKVIIYRNQKF